MTIQRTLFNLLFSFSIVRDADIFVSSNVVQDGLGMLLLQYAISFVRRDVCISNEEQR